MKPIWIWWQDYLQHRTFILLQQNGGTIKITNHSVWVCIVWTIIANIWYISNWFCIIHYTKQHKYGCYTHMYFNAYQNVVEIQENYQTNICAMLAIHIGLRRLFPVDKAIPSRKPCQLLIFQQEIMLTYIKSLRIKHEHDTDIHQWEWVLIPLMGIIVLNLFIAYNNINHRVRFCATRTIDKIAKANRRRFLRGFCGGVLFDLSQIQV